MSKVKTTAVSAGTAPLSVQTGPVPTNEADVAPPTPAVTSPPQPPPDTGTQPPVPQVTLPVSDTPVPNRPGLETPQVTIEDKDPFMLIRAWRLVNEQGSPTYRSLRAMPVPGGCIVRLSAAAGSQLSESICFVKNVKIENGQLVAA